MEVFAARRQTAVCMIVAEIPYNIRDLYVDIDGRATSVGAVASLKGSWLSDIVGLEPAVGG